MAAPDSRRLRAAGEALQSVAVAGVGLTEMSRRLETTTIEACVQAAQAALADAGITLDEVDGIAARWPGPGGTVFHPGSADWADQLGLSVRWIGCQQEFPHPTGCPGAVPVSDPCAVAASPEE